MNIQQLSIDNQRERDWRVARLGHFTGSRIAPLMTTSRKKDEVFGATARTLIYEIMSERELISDLFDNDDLWNRYVDLTSSFSKAMQFGTDNEQDAIDAFDQWLHAQETITLDGQQYPTSELEVLRGGSVDHPTIANFSASPDAVVYSVKTGQILAVVETKVPLPKTFMQYRSEIHDGESLRAVNADYYYQVHGEMMVTSTRTCFFTAYNPFVISGTHVARIDMCDESVTLITERLALAEEFIASKS